MKKLLFTLFILAIGQSAWAQRFPVENMEVAVLRQAQFPQVQLSSDGFSWLRFLTLGWLDGSQTFNMTMNVRIRDENNRFITHNRLPQHTGKVVALRRTNAGQVSEIWILTPAEHEAFRQLAERKAALQSQQPQ